MQIDVTQLSKDMLKGVLLIFDNFVANLAYLSVFV